MSSTPGASPAPPAAQPAGPVSGSRVAPGAQAEGAPPARVFTLLVETRCNSYCVFCGSREVDEALVRSRQRLGLSIPEPRYGATRGRYTLETATAALQRARDDGFVAVSLQGGEPTIWPELPALIRAARALGFVHVGMVTNGRRLADAAYARSLVEAGLTGLSASLLGADAVTHDALAAAPGAFDALVRGLCNVAAARTAERPVFITTNLVTTARLVDHLPDAVRLLASCGAIACTIHLVRFEGLASDEAVREPLRFDIRRVRGPLAEARAVGRTLGVAVHAPDVPLCLHDEPDPEEVRRVAERAGIDEHRFEAAAYAYDLDHSVPHVRPAACEGCWLDRSCRRVPADYLPPDPGDALRRLDAAALAALVQGAATRVDPAAPDAREHLERLLHATDRLEALADQPGALSDSVDVVRRRLLAVVHSAAGRRDGQAVVAAVCTWLGLHPPRGPLADDVVAFAAVPVERLAAHVGAGEPASRRLRFGGVFDVSFDGEEEEGGSFAVSRVVPVMPPARGPLGPLLRAVLLLYVAAPLRGARRLRLDEDALRVDGGDGLRVVWSIARPGAIRLV